MTAAGWLQIALFGAIVIAITRPFGWYMARVFAGERTLLRLVHCNETITVMTQRVTNGLLPMSVARPFRSR